jgi:hypothetical protein
MLSVAQSLAKPRHEASVVREASLLHEDARKSPVVIEISGIPRSATKDMFAMYLENNRRSGGGPVANVDYNSATGYALVTFRDDSGESLLRKLVIWHVIFLKLMLNV